MRVRYWFEAPVAHPLCEAHLAEHDEDAPRCDPGTRMPCGRALGLRPYPAPAPELWHDGASRGLAGVPRRAGADDGRDPLGDLLVRGRERGPR